MQFLRRSLAGLFLVSLTLGLLGWAAGMFWSAVEERASREARERPARERVMAINTVLGAGETIAPALTVFGEVESRRELQVRASAAGRVVELASSFEDGAAVEAGDLLVRIDPTDAQAALDVARTDLDEAEAELRDAERALIIARDELAADRAQAELRAQALTRQRDLAARGVGTAAAVEDAALAESAAQQSVLTGRQSEANAESRVDQAVNDLARTRIALANAERDLDDTEIRAAFSGTLAEVSLTEGGLVTANEQIATLIDPAALEVAFRVSTTQYARLIDDTGSIVAAPVRVTLDVLGVDLEATGRVTRVGADVGEGQTGRRLFALLEHHAGFRPGDFVSVEIEEPALTDVARLPATAVDAAGTVLAIGADDRLEVIEAPVLRRQADSVIVPAVDIEGRRVVSERTPLLGPGIKVRDLTAARDGREIAGGGAGPGTDSGAPGDDRITLTPERRAALIAAVQGSTRMPQDAKDRLLSQLGEETVPAAMVARIESRTGG
ncbi:MAG: HlyD family efflux transporter periplasmic adaptor subunit [Pseudomonadota bacterium]